MNKILKPYTIVPSNLYVERSADRQVKNILEDMGRPGYVLVSRQMGKTNLLINARRKYGNDNDKFVYVDLSNLFGNETQCFRNIIDTAIETNLDVFSQLEIKIRDYRNLNSELPPHKQHEKELRMLLNSINGKLIIILDEIDALTKVEYSDRIFAQIRSIYFARTNYEEFNRLSYLLSGVVEPSELIKDPKISPFNIGEKIFLNDFSRVEFDTFLYKAELSHLEEKIKNRIFYWTNGNPRLTWDLCCIIEDQSEMILSELDIDFLVKMNYLTSFDKPPIDNIREIVKKDFSIQDALIEIEYGKGDVISDNIKQKLYLSGIINYTENDIKIKNRIIKESLSSQWIDSIRNIDENLLDKGITLYKEGLFKKAINTVKSYLTQNNITENSDDFNIGHYYLGLSHYYDNNFEDALINLNKVNFDPKQYGNPYFKTELFKGYIFQKSKKYIDAQEAFEKIVNIGINDEFYLSAKINLGVVLSLNAKNDLEKLKSNEILQEIANSKVEDYQKIDFNLYIEARTIALFFLGDFEKKHNSEEYAIFLNEALLISPQEFKPAILFGLYKKEEKLSKQIEYLDLIVNEITENNLKLTKNFQFTKINFTHKLLREIQLESFKMGKIENFEILIDYEKSIISSYNDVIILDKLVGVAQDLDYQMDFILRLTEFLYNKCEDKTSEIFKNALKLLSSFNYDTKFKYSSEYIKILDQDGTENIDITDMPIFINLIQNSFNNNNLKVVFELISIGKRLKLKLSGESKDYTLLFDFFEMKYKSQVGQTNEAKKLALSILNQAKTNEEAYLRNPLVGQTGLQNIIKYCQNILSILRKNTPLQSPKKIGRNDMIKVKYKNGEEIIAKYKKVEFDLNKGNCIIIN
jgi:tetratricopeptide (TPR) repeat protein